VQHAIPLHLGYPRSTPSLTPYPARPGCSCDCNDFGADYTCGENTFVCIDPTSACGKPACNWGAHLPKNFCDSSCSMPRRLVFSPRVLRRLHHTSHVCRGKAVSNSHDNFPFNSNLDPRAVSRSFRSLLRGRISGSRVCSIRPGGAPV